jgi:glycosyltransferase involved in cell wall biosynthesis
MNSVPTPVQSSKHLFPEAARPLKVSIVASDLSKSGAGRWQGAVRPFLLAQALQYLGHEVELLGFADEGDRLPADPNLPIKVIPKATYPRFLGAARRLMSQIEGDIVYAYKLKPSSFGLALLYKLQKKCPVILDIDDWELSWHGGDQWRYPGSFWQLCKDILKPDGALRQPDYPLYLQWIEKLTASADAITLHTQFIQSRFGGSYIPNGKDMALFDPSRYDPQQSRDRYGLAEYKVLMFPGAPRPYKGVEDVLKALDQLNQSDLRLVIVGGSPYDDYDDYLIENWGKWIVKLPKAPYSEMPSIVAAAHVLMVPQRDTPAAQAQFPLKLTDGMAMAKPVLATRVGDIPAILGDTGYLVDPEAPDQIAAQLSLIFADLAAANQQGARARQRCLEHYSIAAMAAHLQTILAEIETN